MKIRPLYASVLVLPTAPDEKTPGGLFLVEAKTTRGKQEALKGTAVAVGSGTVLKNGTLFPCEVKVGDTVLYTANGSVEVDVDGVKHAMVHESAVFAILD